LSIESKKELEWWISNIETVSNTPISAEIYTDASDNAWGLFTIKKGKWCLEWYRKTTAYIKTKELLAIIFGIYPFSNYIKGKHIKIFCDNITAIATISRMGSSKKS